MLREVVKFFNEVVFRLHQVIARVSGGALKLKGAAFVKSWDKKISGKIK